jgi:hypothetical protein
LNISLPLLAETGPLSIKIQCCAKAALLSVSPSPLVEVGDKSGGVMLADSASRNVVIRNDGALEVVYDVKVG